MDLNDSPMEIWTGRRGFVDGKGSPYSRFEFNQGFSRLRSRSVCLKVFGTRLYRSSKPIKSWQYPQHARLHRGMTWSCHFIFGRSDQRTYGFLAKVITQHCICSTMCLPVSVVVSDLRHSTSKADHLLE
jgi:hypothetical protein